MIDEFNFHLDTIVTVVENEDSIYYEYNRTSFDRYNEIYDRQNKVSRSFAYADFENIVSVKPNLMGYGKGTVSDSMEEVSPIWWVSHWKNSMNNSRISAYWDHIVIDTASCSTGFSSLGAWFSLEQKRGLIGERTNVNNENFESIILIGSKINGVEEGSFEVITGIETQATLPSFQLYPNPATNYINLTETGLHFGSGYSIVDINGGDRTNGGLSKEAINISHLEPGIYFFKVESEQKTFTLKFVKQDF